MAKVRECEGCGTTGMALMWVLVNGEERTDYCWHCIKQEVGEMLELNEEVHAVVNQQTREVVLQ